MYKGKYSRERRRRPALWAALALALVLTLSVGGTVAYLFTNTDPVTNTFTPAEAKVKIEEKFEDNVKSSITVKNTGNIPVYVRVMLVASYQKEVDGKYEVCGTHTAAVPNVSLTDSSKWEKIGDYYYYTEPVSADSTTENLLSGGSITLNNNSGCCEEHVDVLAQAIQAQPDSAVKEAWSVTLDSNGNITSSSTTN